MKVVKLKASSKSNKILIIGALAHNNLGAFKECCLSVESHSKFNLQLILLSKLFQNIVL